MFLQEVIHLNLGIDGHAEHFHFGLIYRTMDWANLHFERHDPLNAAVVRGLKIDFETEDMLNVNFCNISGFSETKEICLELSEIFSLTFGRKISVEASSDSFSDYAIHDSSDIARTLLKQNPELLVAADTGKEIKNETTQKDKPSKAKQEYNRYYGAKKDSTVIFGKMNSALSTIKMSELNHETNFCCIEGLVFHFEEPRLISNDTKLLVKFLI